MKDRIKKEVEEMIRTKISKSLGKEIKALQELRLERATLKGRLTGLTERSAKLEIVIRDLEQRIRTAVTDGGTPSKQIAEATERVAELRAINAAIEEVKDADLQLSLRERDLANDLADQANTLLLPLRATIEERCKGRLERTLWYMASFEQTALDILGNLRVELKGEKPLELGRFLGLATACDDLEPYTAAYPKREAFLDRRQTRRRLFGN